MLCPVSSTKACKIALPSFGQARRLPTKGQAGGRRQRPGTKDLPMNGGGAVTTAEAITGNSTLSALVPWVDSFSDPE